MRFSIFVCITLLMIALLLTIDTGYSAEWAIEAEMAHTIEAPMVIAEDDTASGGKFVWMEGPPATGGGGEGWAEYKLHIPVPGTYALWGKVIAWDGNSDSFWVTWQPADPDEDPQQTNNTEFRWSVSGGAEWHWDRINHWLDGGTFEREWVMEAAGETTLRIAVREDAAMLDVIYITDNLSADAAEVNPRDPIPEDSQIAVEPRGKLTTTWARLKAVD